MGSHEGNPLELMQSLSEVEFSGFVAPGWFCLDWFEHDADGCEE